jgi:hypothetical protein
MPAKKKKTTVTVKVTNPKRKAAKKRVSAARSRVGQAARKVRKVKSVKRRSVKRAASKKRNPNALTAAYRAEQKAKAAAEKAYRQHLTYGVFTWSSAGKYPKSAAHKIFRHEKTADNFVNDEYRKGREYVVRPIYNDDIRRANPKPKRRPVTKARKVAKKRPVKKTAKRRSVKRKRNASVSASLGKLHVSAGVKWGKKPNPARKRKPARKTVKRNAAPAGKTFKKFTGRPSTKEATLNAPNGTPRNLDKLGTLVELRLKSGTVIRPKSTVWLCADSKGSLHLATSGARLVDLPAGSLGRVRRVEYRATKAHLDGKPTTYYHDFGEINGRQPELISDGKGGLKFKGGAYKITARGIEN